MQHFSRSSHHSMMKHVRTLKWRPFLHHLVIATSLTSMVFLAKHIGMTTILDGLTLNLSQRLLADSTDKLMANRSGGTPPALLVITPEDYRDVFDNTSPLKRDQLAAGLKRLFKSNPKAILIDLDLSPSTSQYQPGDQLDNVLDGVDKTTTNLVLITPILREVDTRAEEWLRQRCQKGIRLAISSVNQEFGIVMHYSEHYPSLGVVARTVNADLKDKLNELPNVCSRLDLRRNREVSLTQQPDQKLQLRKNLTDLDNELWEYGYQKDVKYVNWTKTQGIKPVDWKTLLNAEDCHLQKSFENRLVFVGSMYDPHDWFQSPLGPRSGIETHMAIANSTLSESHVWPFVLEILSGTLLGIFGAWCWKMHRVRCKEHVTRAAHAHLALWGHAHRFALRGMLFVFPALAGLLFVILFMRFSLSWLAAGVWLNPVPLAVGVLLHTLLTHEDTHEGASIPPINSERWFSPIEHPAWVILAPLIGCALILLVTH